MVHSNHDGQNLNWKKSLNQLMSVDSRTQYSKVVFPVELPQKRTTLKTNTVSVIWSFLLVLWSSVGDDTTHNFTVDLVWSRDV